MAKQERQEKRERSKIVEEVYAEYERLRGQSSERRSNYDTYKKWFEGDESVMWSKGRPDWMPKVIANLLEAKIRTKIAILTDNKPKFYVYGIPEVDMIEDFQNLAQLPPGTPQEQLTPGMQQAQGLINLSKNMNIALDHIWRYNDMNEVIRRIVIEGSITGLLACRVYWDNEATKYGEVKIESIHPRYIYFDENIKRIDFEDGSCDWFIVAVPRPLTWFNYYFPGKEVQELPGYEDKSYSAKMGLYIEAYSSDFAVTKETTGEIVNLRKSFPSGKYAIIGGNTLLSDGWEPIDVFPYVVRPYELSSETYMGDGDVRRGKKLQEDFNSKISQLSLNVALTANKQKIVNLAQMGIKKDVLLEHTGEPGYIFFSGKNIEDVKKAMTDLNSTEVNVEALNYIYLIPSLLEEVMGISRTMSSGAPAKKERQSQYEIAKQYESGVIRQKGAAHNIESFLTDVGNVTIENIKRHWHQPRKIYAVNNNKLNVNVFEYPRDENDEPIDYDFIVTIQPETMLPVDLQSQAERDMNLFQMTQGKFPDPQTLLESVHHPKIAQIMQRLKEGEQNVGPAPQTTAAPGPAGA